MTTKDPTQRAGSRPPSDASFAPTDAQQGAANALSRLWRGAFEDAEAAHSTEVDDEDGLRALRPDHKERAMAAFALASRQPSTADADETGGPASTELPPYATTRQSQQSPPPVVAARDDSDTEPRWSDNMDPYRLAQRRDPHEVTVANLEPRTSWLVRRPVLAHALLAACIVLSAIAGNLLANALGEQRSPSEVSARSASTAAAALGASATLPLLNEGEVYAGRLDSHGDLHLQTMRAGYLAEQVGSQLLMMVRIPEGTFEMGSPEGSEETTAEPDRQADEGPVHRVTFEHAFYMSRYEVTRALWREVATMPKVDIELNPDPAYFKSSFDQPVQGVSYWEAIEFCKRLKMATGRSYRLPTEAEWEYAARAGTQTPFAFGDSIDGRLVNYNCSRSYGAAVGLTRCGRRDAPIDVGSFGVANRFGLFDMHGNVWEWVEDVHSGDYLQAPSDGSAKAGARGDNRVARGGGWRSFAGEVRAAARLSVKPGQKVDDIGFRVVAGD